MPLDVTIRHKEATTIASTSESENPLDESERFADLMLACRLGDLSRVQEHISAGVNINSRDAFDYTPLIIACLVGHYDLVKLLLESGALAERSTFQGERAVYGALTDKIRRLLLSYDYKKSTGPWIYWTKHISSLLTKAHPHTADLSGAAWGDEENLQMHKFMLAARVPFLERRLRIKGDDDNIWGRLLPLGYIPEKSIRIAIKWLYMSEQIETLDEEMRSSNIVNGVGRLVSQWAVPGLGAIFNGSVTDESGRTRWEQRDDDLDEAQKNMTTFFENNVLGRKMMVERQEDMEAVAQWTRVNDAFADCLLRANFPISEEEEEEDGEDGESALVPPPMQKIAAPQLGIALGSGSQPQASLSSFPKKPRAIIYPAHKAMLIRSPYFETMFGSPFVEGTSSTDLDQALRIITVDCSPVVLEATLRWMYTDHVVIGLDIGLDVLYIADMLLLETLKSKAAVAISTLTDRGKRGAGQIRNKAGSGGECDEADENEVINIYDVIHAGWDLRVPRLEECAARYLAARLEYYIDEPEFADLIRQSAGKVRERQSTDTIELLDDIRYYLNERFKMRFEDLQIHSSLKHFGWDKKKVDGKADKADDSEESEETGQDSDASKSPATDSSQATSLSGEAQLREETQPEKEAHPEETQPGKENNKKLFEGGFVTFEGEVVEDEFVADARNYDFLLAKIDELLDRLGLDA